MKRLKLRKEIKVVLLIALIVISYNYASANGALASESTIGAIKVILAWLAIPVSLIKISTIIEK